MVQSCCGGAAATVPFNDADKWSSNITQKYNTFMASADWKAIPGKLDFKADYVAAISNEANNTSALRVRQQQLCRPQYRAGRSGRVAG